MSNYKDFRNKDTEFTGIKGIDLPEGATSTRVNEQGRLRFNSETGLAEYYNGTIWKSIDAPPAVSSASPTAFASDGSTLFTIQVTGQGFDSGGTSAKFVGDDGTEYISASVTFVSATRVDVQTVATMTAANGPYDIQVTNTGSGLSGTGGDLITAGSAPTFTSPAADANLGSIYNGQTALAANFTRIVTADADGSDRTYSISSGSLPAGITINTNDGTFEGTCTQSDAAADFTFTVQITDGLNTATRQFVISQILIPTIEVLVVAGGGGGGGGNRGNNNYSGCGGGGAGGYRTGNLAVGAGTYTVTVGGGGTASPGGNSSSQSGSNSEISAPGLTTITSAGGGYGGRETEPGNSGGSGGGGGSRNGEGPSQGSGGSGNSPSVSPSQGSSGGGGANDKTGGGGGGASQSGTSGGGSNSSGAPGGNGTANNITGSSVTYAGGGGGGIHGPSGGNSQGPGGTGGGGTGGRHNGPQDGTAGTANLGGGGGGSGPANTGQGAGGGGGSGVVILKVATAAYSGTTTGSPTVTTDGTDTIIKFTGSGTYNG